MDGNGKNNRVNNLKYGTHQNNMADMIRHGRTTKGERDGMAKLTDPQVLEIVEMLRQGVVQRVIGERFGISQTGIGFIARSKTWGHVTEGLLPAKAS